MKVHSLIIVFFLLCEVLFGQNLLLNRTYSFEPAANYGKASSDPSRRILTDGSNTSKYFWLQNTTVGWQNRGKIVIDFDIINSSNVGKITFNTARNSGAGVEYPNSVYVFGSLDKGKYTYLGDILNSKDNISGKYKVNKFILNVNNAGKFRYFKFYIIPNGHYAFVDEIEILKGNSGSKIDSKNLIANTDLDSYVNKLISPSATAITTQKILKINFTEKLLFDWVSPWDTEADNQYKVKNNKGLGVSKSMFLNDIDFLGFNITNNSNSNLNDISFDLGPNKDIYEIFLVPAIKSLNKSKIIYDALVPVSKNISFEPDETKRFLIKIKPNRIGNFKSVLSIKNQLSISFNVRVLNKSFNSSLNTNVWAYLTNPLIIANKSAAVRDLKNHNINTIVVPAEKLGKFDSNNSAEFENYLSNFAGYNPKNVILFCNFLSKSNQAYFAKYPINSAKFKSDFISWYKSITNSLVKLGFNKSNICLYPYDEISNKNDISNFNSFLKWLKPNLPSAKVFMTIGNKSLMANDYSNFVQLVDVIQFADTKSNINLALSDNSHIEKWIYDARPGAEVTSPYSYYRMMSWKAYYYGFSGVGFWSYSDYKAKPFDDVISSGFFKSPVNYSVIYINNNTILSSKRWEAFLVGSEDYDFLKFAESKIGKDKVKQFVKKVLDNQNDIVQIDNIKNQMYNLIY